MPTAYQNPTEASEGLTSAFSPTTDAQRMAIANAASLVPSKPNAISPTVVTGANINEEVLPEIKNKLRKYTTNATDSYGNRVQVEDPSMNQGSGFIFDDPTYNKAVKGETQETSAQDDVMATTNKILDTIWARTDPSTQRTLDAIRSNFSVRKAQQDRINSFYKNRQQSALLQSGSSRYAPLSSGQIMQGVESFGVEQLAALDSQEQTAIANAQAAADDKNWQLADRILGQVETIRKEKQKKADEIETATREENKRLTDQMIQASRDEAVAGLIGQGISDPAQILSLLNSEGVGDFTADEIKKTLDNLSVGGNSKNLGADLETFNYLQKNGMLPDSIQELDPSQQYLAYLNMQKLANSGKLSAAGELYGSGGGVNSGITVGKGATTDTEEQIIRTRLFAKLATILNKGTLSDADRAIIDERIAQFRNAGMSEQEIMSALAGFPTDVKTPYNSSFIDLVAANTDTNEQQQTQMGKVGQLLAAGNDIGAMKAVENTAMTNAKKLDPDNYMGSATATTFLSNIDKIRTDLADGGITGYIPGSLQNVLGKIKGSKTATLKADITNLVAQFRKDLLGSAVTPSEKEFLADLIPDISSNNFIEQLNAFQNGVLNRYNGTRSSVNLPEVNYAQALKPQDRLSLYATDSEAGFWGEESGGYEIFNESEGYILPQN